MITAKEARHLLDQKVEWSRENTESLLKTFDKWIRKAIEDNESYITVSQLGTTKEMLSILEEKGYLIEKTKILSANENRLTEKLMYIIKW